MQANELMIGDLALIDGVPRRVCAITKHKVGYHLCERESTMHYVRLQSVVPIPLTAEILEKNGFTLDVRGTRYDIPDNDYYGISSYLDVEYNKCWTFCASGIFLFDIPYIHELQHALRLCGLNNLADNFKI